MRCAGLMVTRRVDAIGGDGPALDEAVVYPMRPHTMRDRIVGIEFYSKGHLTWQRVCS